MTTAALAGQADANGRVSRWAILQPSMLVWVALTAILVFLIVVVLRQD